MSDCDISEMEEWMAQPDRRYEMTDREIISNAIDKAIANGLEQSWKDFYKKQIIPIQLQSNYQLLIFSHSFAKAFWGEEDCWHTTGCTCGGAGVHSSNDEDAHYDKCAKLKVDRGYKFHLQQMILKENPLKYLEQFL